MSHAPTPPNQSPNVLLVVLDTVAARYTSLHGYGRETTPGLARLADDSETTVFSQARAPSNWSLPSHASLLTGVPASLHELTMERRLRADTTVFERLADAGYRTAVLSENPWLTDHPAGFAFAFETVVSQADVSASRDGSDTPDGYDYAGALLDWVDDAEASGDPWAACLNLMDAHFPYRVREPHDEFGGPVAWAVHDSLPRRWEWDVYAGDLSPGVPGLLEPLYESAIRQADAVVEGVVSELRERGIADETLVVVTSDHGECFGAPPPTPAEPPAVEHGLGTHESLYHVPLLVRWPAGLDSVGRAAERRAADEQTCGERVTSLASVARFPEAVAAARRGADPVAAFRPPGGHVVAHQPTLHETLRERARDTCPDPERFARSATLLYEDRDGDAVGKRAVFGDTAYETTVRGTARGVRSPCDPEAIRTEADGVADTRARQRDRGSDLAPEESLTLRLAETDESLVERTGTATDAVARRLADLGYL